MEATRDPRIVLVHDWLTGMRGGEKCLEVVCRQWPQAPLYTLLHRPGAVSRAIEDRPIHTSPLQALPGAWRYYRYLLPLMPLAAGRWQLPACDLVLSFSHCVAKAVPPPAGVPHVCYCFTPMRYAWHMRQAYFGVEARSLKVQVLGHILRRLRDWDRRTADRVSHFVAISRTVQERIQECYGRSSTVIYPPVDTDFYCPAPVAREDYYLVVSAFAPYKRVDLAIRACNRLRRRLVVIGSGQEAGRLRQLAGPTIAFLGWQPDAVIRDHLRRCRALLFPGEEDFGIVPLEAQACGAPVVAFGRGGATETVIPLGRSLEPTGLWFEEQTTECLMAEVERLESFVDRFTPQAARRNALTFNTHRFAQEILDYLDTVQRGHLMPQRRAA